MANPIDPRTHTHDTILYGARGATNHIAGIGPRSQAEQTGNLAHNPFKCLQRVTRDGDEGRGKGMQFDFNKSFVFLLVLHVFCFVNITHSSSSRKWAWHTL